jgi:hypothetical protein
VIDTHRLVSGDRCQILSGFFIMAMAVRDPFVAQSILSSKGEGDTLVNFEQITIAKVES